MSSNKLVFLKGSGGGVVMYIAYLLLRYCAKKNISVIELAEHFGEPVATVRDWISGRSHPEDKHLVVLGYLFVGKFDVPQCSKAYLNFRQLRDLDKLSKTEYNTYEF